MSLVVTSSYCADNYGPMGGDAKLKIFGVGGGGGNALNRMISSGLTGGRVLGGQHGRAGAGEPPGAEQAADRDHADAGAWERAASPSSARRPHRRAHQEIAAALTGADMVFVTAGMGGGTGTGAAPVVARLAKDMGILTVGVVTFPFTFEGRRRANQATDGVDTLQEERRHADRDPERPPPGRRRGLDAAAGCVPARR